MLCKTDRALHEKKEEFIIKQAVDVGENNTHIKRNAVIFYFDFN